MMTASREIVYEYVDELGKPLFQTVRGIDSKSFRQRQVDGRGRITWSLTGVERVPYLLPRLLELKTTWTVFNVEGEKDADRLNRHKLLATTNAGGAAWQYTPKYVGHFKGAKRIVVLADSDAPGRKAARERAAMFLTVCADVRLVDLAPDRSDGYDVSDWLDDGHTAIELKQIVEAARVFAPESQLPAETPSESGEPHLVVTRADQIHIRRVEWLSPKRIPIGGMTLFDGPGGVGKTTFLTGVISAATRGRDFFTKAEIAPQVALIVGVEDRRELTAARLRLYNADMTRVQFVDATHIGGRNVPLVLPDHVGVLGRQVVELGVGLVYVDALFSHLSIDGEGKMSQQVRAALQPIGEMCERQNVSFMAVRHWTKATGSALSRALGSVEFTNFARSVFTFGQHPSNDELVVCAHTKSNYAELSGAIAFRLAGHDVFDDDGKPWQVSIAEDVAACEGVTSDDLTMRTPSDPDEKNTAGDWLRDHLADGQEHLAEDVQKAAAGARIGHRNTITRAARSIGVVMARTSSFPSVGTWRLPLANAPEAQSHHSHTVSTKMVRLGDSGANGAPQTLTQQGSGSRTTVTPRDINELTVGATGDEPQTALSEAADPGSEDLL